MLTKRMSSREARDNFSDLLASVRYGGQPVIVERNGKPFAVLISPEEYERYQRMSTERFFRVVDDIQARNSDADPDEALADVTTALEEVRREENGAAD